MDQAVPVMPSTIEVWFSEAVKPEETILRVLASDGGQADLGNTKLDLQDPTGTHMTVGVHPGLDNGVYTVQWTSVAAANGETDSGSYQFTVDPGASPQALPQVATQQAPAQLAGIDTEAEPVGTGRNPIWYGLGAAVAALALVVLLVLWFFRRPARGRRWRDDVVDRL
ncbi:MAG: copper resistance protein CopC [Thermomicrobiales bacterium]|nr:copper resistance protein CopC [Thermomicrobiales bacterium]